MNLPRLAIQSKGNEEDFFKLLDKTLDLTRDSLLFRHNGLKGVVAKQAPILYQSGAVARLEAEDTIDHLLYGGYSSISIGYVGMYNAMMSLYGESFFDSDELMKKAEVVMQYMKDYAEKTRQETNIGFSLYSTPAETLATKFCKADQLEFGIIEGVNDNGYYENSFHYPSNKDISPFEKIDKESKYSRLATAGAIQYVEFGSMIHNVEALEEIIRYAYDKCHYFGVNVSSDRCFKCDYTGEMITTDETNNAYKCPQCGNEDTSQMSVIRRLCGYLSSLNDRPSVDNKMKEISRRVKHFKEQ